MIRMMFVWLVAAVSLFALEGFITADALHAKMKKGEKLVVIDVGSRHAFRANHIPGAQQTDARHWRKSVSKYYLMREPEALEQYVRSLGVDDDTLIVLYGHNRKKELLTASYIALALHVLGNDNTVILDGGFAEWEFDDSRSVESGMGITPKHGNFTAKVRDDVLVDLAFVQQNLFKMPMLEARPSDYYFGRLFSNGVKRAGHIPGAISGFWKHSFTEDELLLSEETVRTIFLKGYGLKASDTVLLYCTGGLEASMNWYLLHRVVGFKKLKLYDASMLEWGNREDTPIDAYQWEFYRCPKR